MPVIGGVLAIIVGLICLGLVGVLSLYGLARFIGSHLGAFICIFIFLVVVLRI